MICGIKILVYGCNRNVRMWENILQSKKNDRGNVRHELRDVESWNIQHGMWDTECKCDTWNVEYKI